MKIHTSALFEIGGRVKAKQQQALGNLIEEPGRPIGIPVGRTEIRRPPPEHGARRQPRVDVAGQRSGIRDGGSREKIPPPVEIPDGTDRAVGENAMARDPRRTCRGRVLLQRQRVPVRLWCQER